MRNSALARALVLERTPLRSRRSERPTARFAARPSRSWQVRHPSWPPLSATPRAATRDTPARAQARHSAIEASSPASARYTIRLGRARDARASGGRAGAAVRPAAGCPELSLPGRVPRSGTCSVREHDVHDYKRVGSSRRDQCRRMRGDSHHDVRRSRRVRFGGLAHAAIAAHLTPRIRFPS